MRVKDLGSRPAPASLRDLFSRLVRGRGPSTPVARREIPVWQERGWRRDGANAYAGSYQTPYGAFAGWIEQDRSGRLHFFLFRPSEEIRRHSHWTCFQHRGSDWYLVHMSRRPKDVSSGIITIEKLITEAHQR